jgi:hypothetical protein
MNLSFDPYVTLGVNREASSRVIAAAYRRCALATHPDHGGGAAAFEQVQSSYELLCDPVARTTYDASRVTTESGSDVAKSAARMRSDAHEQAFGHGEHARSSVHRLAGHRRWYALSSFCVFGALIITSWARGLGVAPHHSVGVGEHLLLGNFVVRGSSWPSATSIHHGGSVASVALLAVYAMALSLPWFARARYEVPIATRELAFYVAVAAVLSVINESVWPSVVSAVLAALAIAGWTAWVSSRRERFN